MFYVLVTRDENGFKYYNFTTDSEREAYYKSLNLDPKQFCMYLEQDNAFNEEDLIEFKSGFLTVGDLKGVLNSFDDNDLVYLEGQSDGEYYRFGVDGIDKEDGMKISFSFD